MTTDEGTGEVEARFQAQLAVLRERVGELGAARELPPAVAQAAAEAWDALLARERGRAGTLSEVGTAARVLTDPFQTFQLGLATGLDVAGRLLLEVVQSLE